MYMVGNVIAIACKVYLEQKRDYLAKIDLSILFYSSVYRLHLTRTNVHCSEVSSSLQIAVSISVIYHDKFLWYLLLKEHSPLYYSYYSLIKLMGWTTMNSVGFVKRVHLLNVCLALPSFHTYEQCYQEIIPLWCLISVLHRRDITSHST